MSKNYRAELTGLFGCPVDENPTGVMMEAGYVSQGLNYRYITMKVEKGKLAQAMQGMRVTGMKGVNLTIPHKVDVIPYLDELSPAAEIIGAVNSVREQDGKLIGENTDGKGFVTSLMEAGVMLNGKCVTVLGSGGAARAVAVECAISGAAFVNIIARNEETGPELSKLVKERTNADSAWISWQGSVSVPEATEILVNCTNVGLYPDENKPDIVYDDITEKMTVCDVVFNPPETGFLQEAKKRGALTVNGLGMLVNQGALNYCLWTGEMAPKEVMEEALAKEFGLDPQTAAGEISGNGESEASKEQSLDACDRTLIEKMTAYYAGDPKRVQHFFKVYEFAKLIGEAEKLPEEEMHILRTAAIVHDIGIKVSEEKYGSSAGKYQEKEGPAVAEPMLAELGYAEDVIDRVLFLIAHHHTYYNIEGMDYQILVEADFLVNLFEDGAGREAAQAAGERIFRTETGKWYLKTLFI